VSERAAVTKIVARGVAAGVDHRRIAGIRNRNLAFFAPAPERIRISDGISGNDRCAGCSGARSSSS
jgi:hypothetical protein